MHGWTEPKLLEDALKHFRFTLGFEELNRDVNRLVFKQRWGMTEELTSSEQKDSGENGETPLEGQNTPQQARPTPPQQPMIRVAQGGQSSGINSDEFWLRQPMLLMPEDLPSNLISTGEEEMFGSIFDFIDATPRKMKRVVNV